jgi:DNA-binding NtrC family response regulator
VRRLAQRILASAGYEVVAVSSGEDAMTAVRSESVDLVLSDVVMPGMSGRDLARMLGSEFPAMPVVLMSGYVGQTEAIKQPFIAKPFDRSTLVSTIEATMSR